MTITNINKRDFSQFSEQQSIEQLSNEEPPSKILRIEEEPSGPTPFGTIIPPVIVYLRIIKPYFNTDEFLQFALVCRKHLEVLNFYWKERSRQEGLDGITWIKVDQDMLWVDNKLIANKSIDKFNYFFSSLLCNYTNKKKLAGKHYSIISLRSRYFFKSFLSVIEAHKHYIKSRNSPLDKENLLIELNNLRTDDIGELCLKTICATTKEEQSNYLIELLKNIPNKVSPQQYKLLSATIENGFLKGENFFDRGENYLDMRAEHCVNIERIEECLQICQEKENHWVAFFILDLLSQEKQMTIINKESCKENPMVLIKKLEMVCKGKIKEEVGLDHLISNYHSYKKVIQEDGMSIEDKFLSFLTVTPKELISFSLKLYEHQLKVENQKAAPLLIHAAAILMLSEENKEISTYPYLKQALQWSIQDFEETFFTLGVDQIRVKSILNQIPFEEGREVIQKELLQQVSECIKKNTPSSISEASKLMSKFKLEDIKNTEIAQSYKQLKYALIITRASQKLNQKNPSLDTVETMLSEIDVQALQDQTTILRYYELQMRLSYKQHKWKESIESFLKIRELENSFSLNFLNYEDYQSTILCFIKLNKWSDAQIYFDIMDQMRITSNLPKDFLYYATRFSLELYQSSSPNYLSIFNLFQEMRQDGFNFLKLPSPIIVNILASVFLYNKSEFFPLVETVQKTYTVAQEPLLAYPFMVYGREKDLYEYVYVIGKQYIEIAKTNNSLYKRKDIMNKIIENREYVRSRLQYYPTTITNEELCSYKTNLNTFDEETKKIRALLETHKS